MREEIDLNFRHQKPIWGQMTFSFGNVCAFSHFAVQLEILHSVFFSRAMVFSEAKIEILIHVFWCILMAGRFLHICSVFVYFCICEGCCTVVTKCMSKTWNSHSLFHLLSNFVNANDDENDDKTSSRCPSWWWWCWC